jgi:hypothetical protein
MAKLPDQWSKDEQHIIDEAQGLHRPDKSINEEVYTEMMTDFVTLKGGKKEQAAIAADLKAKQLLPDVHYTDAGGRMDSYAMALNHPGDTVPIEKRADAIDDLAMKALKGDAQAKADLQKSLVDMRNTTSDDYRAALIDQLQQNGSSHLNLIPHVDQTTMAGDGREALTFHNFHGSVQIPISEETDAQRQAREAQAAADQDRLEKSIIGKIGTPGLDSGVAADALARQIIKGKND